MSYQHLLTGRVTEIGRAYFITTVTQGRIPIFQNLYCARIVINNMKRLHDDHWVESLSWVVMPDHVHWLFQLMNNQSLPNVVKHFKARSAQGLNKHLGSKGPLWQKAFYDRAVRDNEDVRQIARYIVANPLRARLVEKIEDYSHWDAIWL